MSQLQHSLEILGFKDIQEVSEETLKKSFKTRVVQAHPDKGGNADEFDKILSAFIFLQVTIQRITFGDKSLHEDIKPEELKKSRVEETIIRLFEEFDRETFHSQFEALKPNLGHGYADWLHDSTADTNVVEGTFGSATQKPPTFEQADLQKEFEKQVRIGKPEPTSLILHPEEMAYHSGTMLGTAIIESSSGSYTSGLYERPEYTDIYAAYTNENTISDKITPFIEHGKTLEEILAERQRDIAPLQDADLEAIANYEKEKQQKEQDHLRRIKDYYDNGVLGGALNNWPPTDSEETKQEFVIQIGSKNN